MTRNILIVIGLLCTVLGAWFIIAESASSRTVTKLKLDEYGVKIPARLKTKKCLYYEFNIKDGNPERFLSCLDVYEYDHKGNLTEHLGYSADGDLGSRWIYKYDKDDNNTEKIWHCPDGRVRCRIYTRYDQKGRMIKEGRYDESGALTSNYVYKYNRNNMIEKCGWTLWPSEMELEKLYLKINYRYDPAGKLIEEEQSNGYSIPDMQTFKTCYKYDTAGKKIEIARYDLSGKLEFKWLRICNNATSDETVSYSNGKIIERNRNIYDAKGNWTKESFYEENGDISNSWDRKYDANDNRIEQLWYKSGKLHMEWTYRYDDKNNLIEETKYQREETSNEGKRIPIKQAIYKYEFYPAK